MVTYSDKTRQQLKALGDELTKDMDGKLTDYLTMLKMLGIDAAIEYKVIFDDQTLLTYMMTRNKGAN